MRRRRKLYSPQRPSEFFLIFKNLLKDRHIGSLNPTSKRAVRRICSKINFGQRFCAVEYGAGTGVFSHYILERMRPDSTLIIIERNKSLFEHLKKLRDSRVILRHDSAE